MILKEEKYNGEEIWNMENLVDDLYSDGLQ